MAAVFWRLMRPRHVALLASLGAGGTVLCYYDPDAPPTERLARWAAKWESNDIKFHKRDVHPTLAAQYDHLFPDAGKGVAHRVLVPLCGKTVDMPWLARKGHEVVGIEGIPKAAEAFAREHPQLEMAQCSAAPGADSKGQPATPLVDFVPAEAFMGPRPGFVFTTRGGQLGARLMRALLAPTAAAISQCVCVARRAHGSVLRCPCCSWTGLELVVISRRENTSLLHSVLCPRGACWCFASARFCCAAAEACATCLSAASSPPPFAAAGYHRDKVAAGGSTAAAATGTQPGGVGASVVAVVPEPAPRIDWLSAGASAAPRPDRSAQRGSVWLCVSDWFAATPSTLGTFARAWDRGGLVAVPPAMRKTYVATLDHLLEPGARLLLSAYDYEQKVAPGPPFALSADEAEALFPKPRYTVTVLARTDVSPEFRQRKGTPWEAIGKMDELALLVIKRRPWWRRLLWPFGSD